MSTFVNEVKGCPKCGHEVELSVALSVNAGRSPHYREAILAGRFQRFTCAKCEAEFRIEDPFMYIDLGRRQWFAQLPPAAEGEWQKYEQSPQQAFEQNLAGPDVSPLARPLAEGVRVRAVFGLDALREKLVCFEAGLDDVQLEALKVDLMREAGGASFHLRGRPRLVGVTPEELVFTLAVPDGDGWIDRVVTVPRDQYARLEAAGDFAPLKARLNEGPYVDTGRLMLAGAA